MFFEEIIGAFTGGNRRERRRQFTVGVLTGAAAGAIAALLFAPQSGSETRADIKETAVHGADVVKTTAKDVAGKTKDKAEDIGSTVSDTYHYFREKASEVSDDASKEARRAARKARVAARNARRDAEEFIEDAAESVEDTAREVKEEV